MVKLSAGVRAYRAVKWRRRLTPVLFEGEEIRAFARNRSVMTKHGIAFTNARVFTFYVGNVENKMIVDWIGIDKACGIDYESGWFRHTISIETEEGIIPFGTVSKSELEFVEEQLRLAIQGGVAPDLAEALELFEIEKAIEKLEREEFLERRDKVRVVGDLLKEGQWANIHSASREKELPWVVLNSKGVGYIAAFENRLVLFRLGFVSSAGGGKLTLGGGTTIRYEDIIRIQHLGKQLDGALEVVTRLHPSLMSSIEDGQKLEEERFRRENCLPLARIGYQLWQPYICEIMAKVTESSR